MNEFGVMQSSGDVYLQKKHPRARIYTKSCFPAPTVRKQEESPLCSEINWSRNALPPKKPLCGSCVSPRAVHAVFLSWMIHFYSGLIFLS